MATTQLGPVIFSRGFRFNPTPLEAATYYLPGLVSGVPLHAAIRPVVHHADVYAGEPSDLARQFFPLPRTDHRFFFSSCKKGVRVAGPGTWSLQSTAAVKDGAGAKVGEVKKFRYKKRGVFTDWLMDEVTACCLDGNAAAGVGGNRQFVFCNIYVSPRAPPDSPAHQESAAFFFAHPAPAHVVIAPTPAPAPPKRPAPESVQPPCPKRMRAAVAAPASFAPPRPCVPNHGVGVAPPSAQPPAPATTRLAAPPRPHVQPMQQMPMSTPSVVRPCHVPQQSCMPQGGVPPSSTPLVMVTRSPPPAPAPTRPAVQPSRSTPPRSPPKQQMPPPPPAVPVGASHISIQAPALHCRPAQPSVQRTRDPFEAAELGDEDEAEEQRVAAAAEAEESPVALQDDDDDLAKSIEDAMATEEAAPDPAASKECPAATPPQGVGFDEFIESLQAADFDKLFESIQCGDFDNNEFLMVPQQAIQAAL